MTTTPLPRRGAARAHRALLVAVGAAALLAGCGGTSSGVTVSQSPGGPMTGSPTPTATGSTTLTVSADDGTGTPRTWTLTCDPPGGDHPDPAGACAALDRNGATALPPVPADRACTMIYGGPQTATVRGTWRGSAVDATFRRTNGCEIARWHALVPLLPDVRGAAAS